MFLNIWFGDTWGVSKCSLKGKETKSKLANMKARLKSKTFVHQLKSLILSFQCV